MSTTSRCGCKAYLTIVKRGDGYLVKTMNMDASNHNHELGIPVPREDKQKLSELSAEATADLELLIECEVPVLSIKRFITSVSHISECLSWICNCYE